MATEEKAPPGVPSQYARPSEASSKPPVRAPAAVIAELLRPRATPRVSREEQAFVDLQRGCHQ